MIKYLGPGAEADCTMMPNYSKWNLHLVSCSMVAVRLDVRVCFHSTSLRRQLDSSTDVFAHGLAEPDFLPLCVRVRLCKPNDVVELHIDSKYTYRPCFTKLEQGSKVAVNLRALTRRVSPVLKLSSV